MSSVGKYLREEMAAQKIKQGTVAIQMGFDPRTFRVRLNRNQFTKAEIEFLIKLLKLNKTAEQLRETYEFEGGQFMAEKAHEGKRGRDSLGSVWSCIQAADQLADREEIRAESMRVLYEQILRNTTPMGLHIICTQTVTPLEMEATKRGSDWRRAMLCGIKQGGTRVYIRPTAKKLKAFNDLWRFQRTIPMEEAKSEYDGFRDILMEALTTEDASGKSKKKVQMAKDLISSRITQIYCDDFPYFIPGFSLGLVHEADDNRRTVQRLTVRVPAGAAFAWVTNELHVFRYVSACRIVIEANIMRLKQKGKLTEEEKAEESVCKHAFRLLNEHFGLTTTSYS